MTQRARPNRDVEDKCLTTFGQVFADGTIIELVSDAANRANLLVYSNRAKHASGPRVKYGSCIYEAPRLDPTLLGATRLPQTFAEYGSLRDLVAKIADQFRKHQNFAGPESKLLAAFAITTWVSDRLSLAPTLVICGPDQAVNALRLLSCFCRRPLMLGDVTPAGLRSLPVGLGFSLLLNQPLITSGMRQLLGASRHRGLYIPGNRGRLLDLFCPRVILSAMDTIDDFGDQSIQVYVEPAQISETIDERLLCAIADEFQPRLLLYRLRNCAKIQVTGTDVLDLAIPTRQLASNLAACFAEDLELAHELISLLRPQDQDLRATQAGNIECVILKIVIGLIHEGKVKRVPVQEISKLSNAFQRANGQTSEHSAEDIGWTLKKLNVHRHRTSLGSLIKLDSATSHQVHRLARTYGLLTEMPAAEGCPECPMAEGTASQ